MHIIFKACLFNLFLFLSLNTKAQNSLSYEYLWEKIDSDTISKKNEILLLDQVLEKAKTENNLAEQFKALLEKSYLTDEEEKERLTAQLIPLAQKTKNKLFLAQAYRRNGLWLFTEKRFQEALKLDLIAEDLYDEIDDMYGKYSVISEIGRIYFYTKNEAKAKNAFKEAAAYFKSGTDYAHKRNYVNNLYFLARTFLSLNETDSLPALIREGENGIKRLKLRNQGFESGYLNFIKGSYAYQKHQHVEALFFFNTALPILMANRDFTSEHLIYLYFGKIAWQQNEKEKAITYFSRIDTLFQQKTYLNYELREAYDYLLHYYKEIQQPQQQLDITERLITLNKQFEKEQQHLTQTLHYRTETKELETSRKALEQQLQKNRRNRNGWLAAIALLALTAVLYGFAQYRLKKKWRAHFDTLVQHIEAPVFPINLPIALSAQQEESTRPYVQEPLLKENVFSGKCSNEEKVPIITKTEQRLLHDLNDFENKNEFLLPLRIDELAERLHTNRNTLSKLINEHKGGNFFQYLNRLRIQKVIYDLKYDKSLRSLSIQGLAQQYGFNNAKTFSTYFKEQTTLTPSYFIEQLELDDIKKQKKS